jgi:FMN phosphatase YigB (HAD superfamily)
MILLFDLDRTLINTEEFKKGLYNIFGLSPKEYNSHVDLFFREKFIHYSPEAHIKLLKRLGHIKTSSEKKLIDIAYKKLLKDTTPFLFPEVKDLLTLLKKQKHKLILVTLGVPSSQKRKVENFGLKKYFEKIIYETKNKSQNRFIKKLKKLNQEILIINDKADESLAIQKMLGNNAKIFLIKSPHSKNITHNEKIHSNIIEIKDFLKR